MIALDHDDNLNFRDLPPHVDHRLLQGFAAHFTDPTDGVGGSVIAGLIEDTRLAV